MKLHEGVQIQAIDPGTPVRKTITLGEIRDWLISQDVKELIPEAKLSPQQKGAITRAKKKATNESK